MVKIEYRKSKDWYNTHCALCGEKFLPTEDRVNGTALFRNDDVVKIYAHEGCARQAVINQACEQIAKEAKGV